MRILQEVRVTLTRLKALWDKQRSVHDNKLESRKKKVLEDVVVNSITQRMPLSPRDLVQIKNMFFDTAAKDGIVFDKSGGKKTQTISKSCQIF
jgi:hypothetical protein